TRLRSAPAPPPAAPPSVPTLRPRAPRADPPRPLRCDRAHRPGNRPRGTSGPSFGARPEGTLPLREDVPPPLASRRQAKGNAPRVDEQATQPAGGLEPDTPGSRAAEAPIAHLERNRRGSARRQLEEPQHSAEDAPRLGGRRPAT